MSCHSAGREGTNERTSVGFETSSLTGRTLTPGDSEAICEATSLRVSIRRAVRMSRRSFGAVRANSMAVLRPMPEEAPVMRIVLPSMRLEIAERDILRI